ncbi:MAG: hypothetical protein ACREIV_13200, partial [Planctomycetaceae bacterium]
MTRSLRIGTTWRWLVCGAGLAASVAADAAEPSPSSAVLPQIQAALEEGLDGGRSRLRIAERHLAAARRLSPDDPRIDHAHGLVLLKNLRYDDAAARFLAAARHKTAPHLPAWQALIRCRLLREQTEQALTELSDLAGLLADADTRWANPAWRGEGARFLGRVLGYLELPGVALIEKITLAEHDLKLRKLLNEELQKSYDQGRLSVGEQYHALAAELNKLDAAMKEEHAAKIAEQQQELVADKQELDDQRKELEMTAEDWQAWIDDQVQRSDKQLELLKKDYSALDQTARALTRSILEAQREITRLETFGNLQRRDGAPPVRNPRQFQMEAAYNALVNRQAADRLKYFQVEMQALAVLQRARRTLAAREAAVQRYKAATG